VYKGPDESKHSHPPNRKEVAAEVITARLKRKAAANPAEPPARLLSNSRVQHATSVPPDEEEDESDGEEQEARVQEEETE